ncbi:MAG: hypothetical protein IMY74_08465, partial [Bacteroidetes bacterium]|nr:hypothetical protein [Bacteroidota bacterium]
MKNAFLLVIFLLPFGLWAQNQPPVAVTDSMETLSQEIVSMNILLNDYDPENDPFEMGNVRLPEHGNRWTDGTNDSILYYVSEYYFGPDSMKYRIEEVQGPGVSEWAWIHVNVLENPDVPYAVNDTFFVKILEPTVLDILLNDGDPNADELIIKQVDFDEYDLNVEISPDSTHVTVTAFYSYWDKQ